MKRLSFLFVLAAVILLSADVYASGTGGPHLWLSTDSNNFDEGGVGYVDSVSGWQRESYVSNNMPFTMYLYNAAPANKGTAYDIGLIVAVHKGDINGSITIADAFGAEQTLTYSDFTTNDPYPGGSHGVYNSNGVFAVLKPSHQINLTTDSTGHADTTSAASSWTQFIVKSSSFSDFHFDAKSTGNSGGQFYNPASHDVTWGGEGSAPPAPEPATLSFLGLGLFGLTRIIKKWGKK